MYRYDFICGNLLHSLDGCSSASVVMGVMIDRLSRGERERAGDKWERTRREREREGGREKRDRESAREILSEREIY